jgi:hypothetical protein
MRHTLGELRELRRRGEPLPPLHWEDQMKVDQWDCIVSDQEAGVPPDEGAVEWLLGMAEKHTLPTPAPEGCPDWSKWTPDDVQWGMLCAKHLVAIGRQAFCAASGRQRIRLPNIVRINVPKKLREHAHLLCQACPQLKPFTLDDLLNFTGRPNRLVIAWVNEHLPEGEQEMREFAEGIAGRERPPLRPRD